MNFKADVRMSGKSLNIVLLINLICLCLTAMSQTGQQGDIEQRKQQYLQARIPSMEKIDRFVGQSPDINGFNPNGGWRFDPDLGWILKDAVRYDGLDDSRTFYHYGKSEARQRINFPDKIARIHSFGNSFTHGDQVNDGETWQEYLAAHLCEPVENFGVGGYSVYQAFLRMKKVEKEHPAEYIIFNIYDDDHYRNLDAWWSIRHSKKGFCSFTLPYVSVNVEKNDLIEIPNPCSTPKDVYKLRDLQWLYDLYKDDPLLPLYLAQNDPDLDPAMVDAVAAGFGIKWNPVESRDDLVEQLKQIHTRAALYSTIKILHMTEQYIRQSGKKLFVILSYNKSHVKSYLRGEEKFDQELVEFLLTREDDFIDLRDCHLQDFKKFNLSPDEYVKRYYIGHYAPAGNFFCAMSIKDKIIDWLDPKPKIINDVPELYQGID